jgi:hypothetical protein
MGSVKSKNTLIRVDKEVIVFELANLVHVDVLWGVRSDIVTHRPVQETATNDVEPRNGRM